jgi:hypothetical protein
MWKSELSWAKGLTSTTRIENSMLPGKANSQEQICSPSELQSFNKQRTYARSPALETWACATAGARRQGANGANGASARHGQCLLGSAAADDGLDGLEHD